MKKYDIVINTKNDPEYYLLYIGNSKNPLRIGKKNNKLHDIVELHRSYPDVDTIIII